MGAVFWLAELKLLLIVYVGDFKIGELSKRMEADFRGDQA